MQTHAKSLNERFRTLISLIFGLAIGCSLLFGESRWETSPLIEESLMLLACFMAGIGAFGRIWCSLYIAGYKNNVLVTDGPYSMCRNPLYFFSFVGSIGVSCATETFTIPLLTALAFGIYYPSVIRKEQERLTALFGDAYRNYCRNVPSFIPSLSRLKPPPTAYSVNPATFTHNIVDALWFIWFIGIFEFISGLHEPGCFPCGSSFRNRLFSPGIQKPRKRPLGNHLTERCAVPRIKQLISVRVSLPRKAQASHTVPTGFSGVPPPGPAIPLTATATSAPERSRAPSAIALTTGSLTAPQRFRTSSGTPSISVFARSA